MKITIGAVATLAATLFVTAAQSQDASKNAKAADFPKKPITLVIPVGAGGSHDLTARAVTSVANQYFGQPIIVELKPGGGGAIGSAMVASAAPDGYTLLFGGTNWSTTLPAVEGRSKGPDDLQAVCRINYSPVMVAARPDAPYKTFKEMIAWAKANPGKLVFGHTGPWGQADLTWKQISKITGIETRSVPHNGGGPLTVALLGGHVDVGTNPTTSFMSQIQAGKIRPLAVLDDKRDTDFPDVPTAKEQGVDVSYQLWRAILAPKDTPRPIIEKLAEACKKMVEDKSVVALIKKLGDEVNYLGPDEFEKVWRAEFKAHKELGESLKK
jgi:tripartite-type tricarboxylate transporter receptor subunit TctC